MSRSAITDLVARLELFRHGICLDQEWCIEKTMTDLLVLIRRRHTCQARAINRGLILKTVTQYLNTGQVSRPENIFHLCLGAGWLDADGKGILTDRLLRRRLFSLGETVTGRQKRLKAFRSLLYAYWSFPLHEQTTSPEAIAGWKEMRHWLKVRHAEISRHPSRKPSWLSILASHLHFLEENPCAQYAKSILEGNLAELQRAIDCLSIPSDSWITAEAVMAQIAESSQWPDSTFRTRLPQLIKVATGNGGIRVTDGLARRAIVKLVIRYGQQDEHEAHEELFLLALKTFGNPWRQQSTWDAYVRDEGGNPCSLSREMVSAWLKDRTIGEFFLDSGQKDLRSELWRRFSVFMRRMSIASPRQNGMGHSLFVHIGEFLVVVPQSEAATIDAYPWQTILSSGGAKLLDQDFVDGALSQNVLDQHKPVIRLSQIDTSQCEEALRSFVFSKNARLPPSSGIAPARARPWMRLKST